MMALLLASAGASAIAASLASLHTSMHGLYWDDGRGLTFREWPTLRQKLKAIRIDHVIVNTNGHEAAIAGRASGRWSASQLRDFASLPGAPTVHAMVWAAPNKAFVNDFEQYCRQLKSAGIRVIEIDAESDGWGTALQGFSSKAQAAQTILDIARAEGLTIGATMIPSRVYPEFVHADYVSIQAYSKYEGGAQNHDVGGYYGPGNMQERGVRAVTSQGGKPIIALAAYDQVWPTGPAANLNGINIAYAKARELSPNVRWWSSKWVVGNRQDPAVFERIQNLVRGQNKS